ncbi:glycosyltransferase family 2 protein [Pedobacter sp. BG31]|uniref:glycosyltransferase family 2 protein n=1 Tax=Pedobacter TaxID=84567 RepID=UPI0011A3BA5B|nr:glycosyltransferase family 2 protein [Pedobacter suwonensis]
MKRVDILMATYNGAKYIEEQILSLINQSYQDWTLLIHDDGSQDGTVDILEMFVQKDNRINFIQDGIRCGGAANNFIHLFKYSTADMIIFCDQDDIWLELKLEKLVALIADEEMPCAGYCNAFAYREGRVTAEKVNLFDRHDLRDSLFLNSGAQGSSLIFNRALLNEIIDPPQYVFMHDHLVTIAAVTFGKLKCLDESLMLYRQHDNNVTGNVSVKYTSRIRTFLDRNNPVLDRKHYQANLSFFDHYSDKMPKESHRLFKAYLEFPKLDLAGRIMTIIRNSFRIGSNSWVLLTKTIIRKPI